MGISVQKSVREIITNLHLLTEELDAWGHMRLRWDWKQLTETWKGTSSEQRLTQRRRKAPHLLVTLTSLLRVKGHTLTWNNSHFLKQCWWMITALPWRVNYQGGTLWFHHRQQYHMAKENMSNLFKNMGFEHENWFFSSNLLWQDNKIKVALPHDPDISLLCIYSRETKTCSPENLFENVYRGFTQNCQKLQTIQMSINWWTETQNNGLHPYSGKLLTNEKGIDYWYKQQHECISNVLC